MNRFLFLITLAILAALFILLLSRLFLKQPQQLPAPVPTPTIIQVQNPPLTGTYVSPQINSQTTPQADPTLQAEQIQQAQADKAYAQRDKQIVAQYPWFFEFPILTDDYFLYFDLQQKQFIAKLYPKTSSQTPYDAQVAQFKNEVLQKLNELQIDTTNYPVSWVIVSS